MEKILIVGHGLAGAVLAQTLIQAGIQVSIVEPDFPHHASKVAAGLINPLIGQKLNPPDKISECLRINQRFFEPFNNLLGKSLYEAIKLHRVFLDEKQVSAWERGGFPFDSLILERQRLSSNYFENHNLYAPYGGGLTRAFKLDVPSLLSCSKKILKDLGCWESRPYRESDVDDFSKVIFCEGFRGKDNQWFESLPFTPAQGEVLKLPACCSIPVSNGTWLLPEGVNFCRAGSTWKHQDLECGPTIKGKNEIIEKLSFLNASPGKAIDHLSGVRSATKDRMPLIGSHPFNPKILIFNGFGSRGATTIPYFAEKMVNFLFEQSPLPSEVDIKRFYE